MPHKHAGQQAFQRAACQTGDCDEQVEHMPECVTCPIVQDALIISPVEVRQFQVGAGGIKTLFGNFVVVNEGLEGLQAIQELVHIVHHLYITTWIGTPKNPEGIKQSILS